jgi:two-component system sensor histidine kinase DesK
MFAGMALLGFLFAPFNAGAAVFVIYSTCFIPHAVGGQIRPTAILIGLILAVVLLESWLLSLPWNFAAFSIGYAIVFGFGNTWAARQTFAAARLAKVAERERIARDLHDVLGHALSVVILKSELAGRLIDRDPARARDEIADVERTAREALDQVRQTIRGYRSENLQAEFEQAKSTLETAGVAVEVDSSPPPITPEQETVLALALREAVTNVVRHAHAATCRLRLSAENGACRLEIQDDGRGGTNGEGFGLRGMRERIEALGGSVVRVAGAGTRLTITLPLPQTPSRS